MIREKNTVIDILRNIAPCSDHYGRAIPNKKSLIQQQSLACEAERNLAIEESIAIANAIITVVFDTFYEHTLEQRQDFYDSLVYALYHWNENYGQKEIIFSNVHDQHTLVQELSLLFGDGINLELMVDILERKLYMPE